MLMIATITGAAVCGLLWIGLWVWDMRQEAKDDTYDNPDHWGDQ